MWTEEINAFNKRIKNTKKNVLNLLAFFVDFSFRSQIPFQQGNARWQTHLFDLVLVLARFEFELVWFKYIVQGPKWMQMLVCNVWIFMMPCIYHMHLSVIRIFMPHKLWHHTRMITTAAHSHAYNRSLQFASHSLSAQSNTHQVFSECKPIYHVLLIFRHSQTSHEAFQCQTAFDNNTRHMPN